MGRVGSALDHAVIESWHSTLGFELRALERRDQAKARVIGWITEYNQTRRHSALGMISPVNYEPAPVRPELNSAAADGRRDQ